MAEKLAANSAHQRRQQQQEQGAKVQHELLSEQHEGEATASASAAAEEGGSSSSSNGGMWDEERVGNAVWRTWPGRMLLLCNAGMLVVSASCVDIARLVAGCSLGGRCFGMSGASVSGSPLCTFQQAGVRIIYTGK